jgi:hypothetical protein
MNEYGDDDWTDSERPSDDNTIEAMTPAPSDGLCEVCERRPGTRREDPYAREIAYRCIEKVMCEVCYTRACQDI